MDGFLTFLLIVVVLALWVAAVVCIIIGILAGLDGEWAKGAYFLLLSGLLGIGGAGGSR